MTGLLNHPTFPPSNPRLAHAGIIFASTEPRFSDSRAKWQRNIGSMKPVGVGEFPRFPDLEKNFPAPASNFPAQLSKIPCPASTGNLLEDTGNSASTQSNTAGAAPHPKKFPAELPATGKSWTKADPHQLPPRHYPTPTRDLSRRIQLLSTLPNVPATLHHSLMIDRSH